MSLLRRILNIESGGVKNIHTEWLVGPSGAHSTVFPCDDSLPQITEGTRVVRMTFTTGPYTKKIIVNSMVQIAELSNTWNNAGAALFLNDGTSAVSADGGGLRQSSNSLWDAWFLVPYETNVGPNQKITLELRSGCSVTQSYYFNLGSDNVDFGDIKRSGIIVWEVA